MINGQYKIYRGITLVPCRICSRRCHSVGFVLEEDGGFSRPVSLCIGDGSCNNETVTFKSNNTPNFCRTDKGWKTIICNLIAIVNTRIIAHSGDHRGGWVNEVNCEYFTRCEVSISRACSSQRVSKNINDGIIIN
ncbi:hypothetical protein V144x_31400 [Gimesia aquarii]|uniref:Uncharacterized protein n=1 Tax=Gimesia aquarii TaxID=2527964 RepID=A0A517VXD8_9PLAN|nr:hypothetical protein V144x_31400 [Gimesia aquarii]